MLDESKLQKGELKALSRILMKMQVDKNDGQGSVAVREISSRLKKGNVREAKELCHVYSEELLRYPEIRRFIHDMIEPIGYWDLEEGKIVYGDENESRTVDA